MIDLETALAHVRFGAETVPRYLLFPLFALFLSLFGFNGVQIWSSPLIILVSFIVRFSSVFVARHEYPVKYYTFFRFFFRLGLFLTNMLLLMSSVFSWCCPSRTRGLEKEKKRQEKSERREERRERKREREIVSCFQVKKLW